MEEPKGKKKEDKKVKLKGIWKGIKITDEDIKEAREELLDKLEEKWRKRDETRSKN